MQWTLVHPASLFIHLRLLHLKIKVFEKFRILAFNEGYFLLKLAFHSIHWNTSSYNLNAVATVEYSHHSRLKYKAFMDS
jgi:hypothetical protein